MLSITPGEAHKCLAAASLEGMTRPDQRRLDEPSMKTPQGLKGGKIKTQALQDAASRAAS